MIMTTRTHCPVLLVGAVSLLKADDALRQSTSVMVTGAPPRCFGTYTGTVEGWDGSGSHVEEIMVKVIRDCHCGSPCCSGEMTKIMMVEWSQIIVIDTHPTLAGCGDDTLHTTWTPDYAC